MTIDKGSRIQEAFKELPIGCHSCIRARLAVAAMHSVWGLKRAEYEVAILSSCLAEICTGRQLLPDDMDNTTYETFSTLKSKYNEKDKDPDMTTELARLANTFEDNLRNSPQLYLDGSCPVFDDPDQKTKLLDLLERDSVVPSKGSKRASVDDIFRNI